MTLIDRIASDLRLPSQYVQLVAYIASHRYKTYLIAKKRGGSRRIDHPARELKLFQRWLIDNIFSRLPVHKAARAYKKGSSIYLNASQHKTRNFMLKVDFQDFFHSIRGTDVVELLKANITSIGNSVASPSDFEVVRSLVCKEDRLTIGAPSSPSISNLVMFGFDSKWAASCMGREIIYTRYADDLYFSTNERNILAGVLAELREDLKTRRPVLRINEEKTVFTSRKRRRLITGLILTSTGSISLGRHRKRFIKALVFRNSKHLLKADEMTSLKGMLSYANSVEPSFVEALRQRYGSTAIDH